MTAAAPASNAVDHDRVAVSVREISKSFPGTKALDTVSFDIRPGRVHALLGGNGCGKSTLIKILAGVYSADSGAGEIVVGDRSLQASSMTPERAHALGFRFVHQHPAVFLDMTVAENFGFGTQFEKRAALISWKRQRAKALELIDRFGISARPDDLMTSLRPADRTMVAIARALSDTDGESEAVLVLDEPTASLPSSEVTILLEKIRTARDAGQTIIYVSHRLDEILEIADDVTILRDGKHVVTRSAEGLDESQLIELIVGRALTAVFPSMPETQDHLSVLEVEHVSGGPLIDVSFALARKEVLGIAGLLGSGRSELLRMIFGAYKRTGGVIRLGGSEVDFRHSKDAIDRGIAYVPEDRPGDGAFLELTVRENYSAATLKSFCALQGIFLRPARERVAATAAIETFRVKTSGQGAAMGSLSGGNQQKVIVGRWLAERPNILLLDEPTQGVDVGARADIYEFVRQEVEEGTSVILVTSDFEELARVSDRVIGLVDGRVTGELRAPNITAHACTQLVYGESEAPHE